MLPVGVCVVEGGGDCLKMLLEYNVFYVVQSINKMYFIIHFNISLCHKVLFGYAQQPQPQRASNSEAEAQWPGGILLKDLGRNLEIVVEKKRKKSNVLFI